MSSQTIMWYFADPMCSWCWGFSPVLEELKAHYGLDLKVSLMMGGLRPGSTEPMTSEQREEILQHWHQVKKLTGQEFTFESAMPDGFIYDTEPPCRAVVSVSEIKPEATLPFFKKLQHDFYIDQKNVVDVDVLEELANSFSIDNKVFLEKFNSDDLKNKTNLHFQYTRQAEVRGFPTLVINTEKEFNKISTGYSSFDLLSQKIDSWLEEHE